MSRKPKPDESHIEWSAHGGEPVMLRCTHCGTAYTLPLPMDLSLFATQLGYFRKAHLHCKQSERGAQPLQENKDNG